MKKETFKQAGYSYVKFLGDGDHLLKNEFGNLELFATNKNHASWGLVYKNTHLEFVRSMYADEMRVKTA
jgi:hypothetical protein